MTQTTTAADIVAYLRELGMVRELIGTGASQGDATPLNAVATDTAAGAGELAWSRRPGAAARFGGSLLVCSAEAAGELTKTPLRLAPVPW